MAMTMNIARRARRTASVAVLVISAAAGGCGGPHYEHATVHGKVTYNGKPVPLGSVLFVPTQDMPDGSVQPASGAIGADGAYELKSEAEKGAVVGEHKVVIIAVDGGPQGPEPDVEKIEVAGPSPSGPAPQKSNKSRFKMLVPQKYATPDTTPIVKKVASGDNTIDIELVD